MAQRVKQKWKLTKVIVGKGPEKSENRWVNVLHKERKTVGWDRLYYRSGSSWPNRSTCVPPPSLAFRSSGAVLDLALHTRGETVYGPVSSGSLDKSLGAQSNAELQSNVDHMLGRRSAPNCVSQVPLRTAGVKAGTGVRFCSHPPGFSPTVERMPITSLKRRSRRLCDESARLARQGGYSV
jgi:hypothetical protein